MRLAILITFMAVSAFGANVTPVRLGEMQSDLNGGGYEITNLAGVFDPGGNPLSGIQVKAGTNVVMETNGNQVTISSSGTGTGVPASRSINTTTPLSGGGDLGTDRTISIANAAADGTTKGAAAFLAADFNSSSGVISIDYVNGQAASVFNNGFLSSADWSTFNSKQPAGNYITALTGDVTASGPGSVAATIANNAVTYAKMQDVTATQRVIGRNTAGSGDPEEVTASQLLDWVGSTRGSLLYRGAGGWAILIPGTAGFVLTSQGTGADPIWAQGASIYTAYMSSDQSLTLNTTNGQNVTGLSVTLPTGNYRMECFIVVSNIQDVGGSDQLTFNFEAGGATIGKYAVSGLIVQERGVGLTGNWVNYTPAQLFPRSGSGYEDSGAFHFDGSVEVTGAGTLMPKVHLVFGDSRADFITINKGSHVTYTKL